LEPSFRGLWKVWSLHCWTKRLQKHANHHFESLGGIFEATKHTTANPIALISYHSCWEPCRALSWSKCQVHCQFTEQTQKVWGLAVSLCRQTQASKGVAISKFSLLPKYIH
jgi:hypothetical protein